MRLGFHLALFAACWTAVAQGRGSVHDLVALVRSELQQARSDKRIARDVRGQRLTERLDDRTVEILESEGAGPETVAALQALHDRSAGLAPPATPAIPEPPAPTAAEQVRVWNAAHNNALSYIEGLPDFICSELIRRYRASGETRGWKLEDTLAVKLTYFDKREAYKLMTVNNRSTGSSYEHLRGAITENEFGGMLAAIFALKSRTNRTWDHWTVLRTRPTHVYAFSIARENSDYQITSGTGLGEEARVRVGQHGFVYIDDATKMVTRLTAIADDFPPDFDVRHVALNLEYDFTEVGGKQYLLPLHSETTLWAPPYRHRNETQFLAYRKFSADTTITYGGPGKQ